MSILKRLESLPTKGSVSPAGTVERTIEEVTESIREKVLETHPEMVMAARMAREKRREMAALVSEMIISSDYRVGRLTRRDLAERIVQEICGLGPIDEFLDDPEVTEIMVNGPKEVFVERNGALQKTDVAFLGDGQVLDLINRIVGSVGRRVDKSSPYVDARLPDGSRVNAVIPPLALNGPVLTVRRFPERYSSLGQLVAVGTMPDVLASFLNACVHARFDIVVSGGSGSGKTTTLNVLANAFGERERIIVIEDSSEVRIDGRHVVYLETRLENVEGKGLVSVRDLLRNALRMRPDRIVIGECRGKETFDLITAMNTGHEGCLSTIHANSSRDCLARLSGMALMSDESVPIEILESWIGAALDLVVHMSKGQGGARFVEEVSVVGLSGDCVQVHPVYTHDQGMLFSDLPSWFHKKIGDERWANLVAPLVEDGGDR